MSLLDEERLTKCDIDLIEVLRKRSNHKGLYEIEVVVDKTVTARDRQNLRKVFSIKYLWPEIIVGTARLENIYSINDLHFVEMIFLVGGSASKTFLKRRGPPTPKRRIGWLERFSKWIAKMIGGDDE